MLTPTHRIRPRAALAVVARVLPLIAAALGAVACGCCF
jgi:hypothetical protein